MITDDFIKQLITCPKTFDNAKLPRFVVKNRSSRCDIRCTSADGQYTFTVFVRKSEEFMEDFSVGLIWTNANNGDTTLPNCILLRCQGPHDGKEEPGTDLHHSYHTHSLTEKDVAEHRYQKPSLRQSTDSFSSFEQAIFYFEDFCGIIGLSKILPPDNGVQLTLLDFNSSFMEK